MVCARAAALITQKVKKYIPKQGLRLATRSEGPFPKFFNGEVSYGVPASCPVDSNSFGSVDPILDRQIADPERIRINLKGWILIRIKNTDLDPSDKVTL
jgi:hypothetical protein